MKKIFGILMLMIIGLSGTAYAEDFQINKGWNLVSPLLLNNFNYDETNSNGDIFFYLPNNKKYYSTNEFNSDNSNFDLLKENLISLNYDFNSFMMTTASWIYFENPMKFSYDYESLNSYYTENTPEFKLFSGWNLISINSLMIKENSFSTFKGDCEIKRVYLFDSELQKWETEDNILTATFYSDLVGTGMAVKVSNDCEFNFSDKEEVSAPPTLPNDENVETQTISESEDTLTFERLESEGKIYIRNNNMAEDININSIKIYQDNVELCTNENFIVKKNSISGFLLPNCTLFKDEVYLLNVFTKYGITETSLLSK
jgi:hypothetical protein